ncbi:hypothetical protein N8987_04525 [Crocinitomix sp.]|nr:hypothetical protein [Crocinitomix sp.]
MKFPALFEGLHFSRAEKKIALSLFVILWAFLFIRAIYLPVLHDEIATFFYYIQSGNYLPPKAHWDANNHVFNSFLSNISYRLFGSAPLAIRLPNVMSFIFLFYAAFQLAGRINKSIIRWGLLMALTCSHYLLEYMAECRGYGMSISLFLMALFHFIKYRETYNWKQMVYTIFFLFLATSANLTLIIPTLILFMLLGIGILSNQYKENRTAFYKQFGLLVILGLPFLLLIKFSFALKERGALYYGGDSGFYDFTVSSVTNYFIGFYNAPIAVFITLLFIGFCLFVLVRLTQQKTLLSILQPSSFFAFLLIASVISILVLSYGLGVNFPEDRAAMYLYILFIASFAFILDDLSLKSSHWKWSASLLFYIPLLFLLHLNPRESVFSPEERTSQSIFDYVSNSPKTFKFPNLIGGYKTQEFCWYYMANRAGGIQGKIHTNYHIALDADFQIVRDGRITDSILFDYYTPVLSDPATQLTLFERKNKIEKELIYSVAARPTPGFIQDKYFNILEIEIDSLANRTLYIGAELTLDAQAAPFIAWLAVNILDAEGNALYQEYIAIDWLRKKWNGDANNLLQGTLLHNIPEKAKTLKFYIWNIENTSYSIPNGKCYLYNLKRDFPNQY